ncbi:MAG: MurR/RpiR family transcriptional regulator [Christensenellales bacterium]|jgi:DNA-binding MurR/RpiR family transcriptional regulator
MKDDLIQRINARYGAMSKGQKRIADYIRDHYDKAVFMTAARMARQIDVSESTVVRFATSLGYDGYPQMQRALQEMLRTRMTSVQRIEMSSEIPQEQVLSSVLKADIQNIRNTLDKVDPDVFERVVQGILSARRIYIMGMRSSAPLAQFLGYYLNFIFPDVHIVTGTVGHVYEELVRITPRDWLFAISLPRYSARTVDGAVYAKEHGAKVVALTDSPFSPLGQVADYNLIGASDMAFFADSLVAPLSVINALIISIGLRKKEEISEYLNHLEGIWDVAQTYTGKENT